MGKVVDVKTTKPSVLSITVELSAGEARDLLYYAECGSYSAKNQSAYKVIQNALSKGKDAVEANALVATF